ncbi:MAG: glutathione S-transferase family protein [Methylococcaceae bacterium]|nr:glutathione S-transferase family protein [Methylococcaceae bacterium]
MTTTQDLIHYHAPNTRSTAVLILLEELGAQYHAHLLNMQAGEQRQPAYLAINPMGKVPAIKHGDAIITEQVAIFIYLADLYPEVGLAPKIGDPLRGSYLRWTAFYGSSFEPAIVDRALKREPGGQAMSPYGDFDSVFKTLTDQLAKGAFMLGDQFTAVDILWGTALTWVTQFQLIPALPLIQAYIDRVNARPLVVKARAKDAEIAAAQV